MKPLLLLLFFVLSPAFAAPLQVWPSRNESCEFEGQALSGIKGEFKLYTRFLRSSEGLKARAIVFISGSFAGVKKHTVMEEEAWFSAQSGNMTHLHRNERAHGCNGPGGNCVQNIWDVLHFKWEAVNSYSAWRIDGTAEKKADFDRRFSRFTRHWPLSMAGTPWIHDFFPAAPDGRADLQLKGYGSNLVSPLLFTFFFSRHMRPGRDKGVQIISHVPQGNKRVSISPTSLAYEPKASSTLVKVSTSFGQFKSPPGRPTLIEVDNNSRQILGGDLFLQAPLVGLIHFKISAKGCH